MRRRGPHRNLRPTACQGQVMSSSTGRVYDMSDRQPVMVHDTSQKCAAVPRRVHDMYPTACQGTGYVRC